MPNGGQLQVGPSPLLPGLAAAALVIAALALVLALEPPGDDRGPIARKLDGIVDDEEPAVVVLGNSAAAKAIDEGALAESLGHPVAKLTVPGSQMPVWYAVLENRVYARGAEPAVVIVAGALRDMLGHGSLPPDTDPVLAELMGPTEPVLRAKVFGRPRSPLHERLQDRRGWVRQALTYEVPGRLAGLVMGVSSDRGRERVQEAVGAVFDESRVDFAQMDPDRIERALAETGAAKPYPESLVPDLVALAHEHGSQVVFVRTPIAPGVPFADPVTVEQERALVAGLNGLGAGYASLWELPLRASDFQDAVHLADAGKQRVTRRVAQLLKDWSDGGTLDPPAATLPFPAPVASRSGTLPEPRVLQVEGADGDCSLVAAVPELAPFGAELLRALALEQAAPFEVLQDGEPLARQAPGPCGEGTYSIDGEHIALSPSRSWSESELVLAPQPDVERPISLPVPWVFPGTSITWTWAEPWPHDRGPLRVEVAAQPLGGGSGVPEVRVGGVRAELEGSGGQLRASLRGPVSLGEWSVEVVNPADGPHLAIVALALGRGPHRTTAVRARSHALDGGVAVIGRPNPGAEYAAEPRALPPEVRRPKLQREGKLGMFRVPELAHLADPATGRCSPVVVLEDGVPLPRRHEVCRDVDQRRGAMCHARNTILFSATDGTRPTQNRRKYTLALDRTPGRYCLTELWLLPGDRLQVPIDPLSLGALYAPAGSIELAGLVVSHKPARGQLGVRVVADGKGRARAKVPVGSIADGVGALRLDPPVSPTAGGGFVELSNPPGGPYVLVRSAMLLEQ